MQVPCGSHCSSAVHSSALYRCHRLGWRQGRAHSGVAAKLTPNLQHTCLQRSGPPCSNSTRDTPTAWTLPTGATNGRHLPVVLVHHGAVRQLKLRSGQLHATVVYAVLYVGGAHGLNGGVCTAEFKLHVVSDNGVGHARGTACNEHNDSYGAQHVAKQRHGPKHS